VDRDAVRIAGVSSTGGGAALVPCAVTDPDPEHVTIDCDAPADGWVVLLDAWSPGWSATVDGAPATIRRAEGLVRAVAVPAGAHRVAFRYRTPWLRIGAIISLLAWALVAFFAIRRPRAAPA
jgi:uncharacterized membrane protein YfhO